VKFHDILLPQQKKNEINTKWGAANKQTKKTSIKFDEQIWTKEEKYLLNWMI
jgi:hypothetical protein